PPPLVAHVPGILEFFQHFVKRMRRGEPAAGTPVCRQIRYMGSSTKAQPIWLCQFCQSAKSLGLHLSKLDNWTGGMQFETAYKLSSRGCPASPRVKKGTL